MLTACETFSKNTTRSLKLMFSSDGVKCDSLDSKSSSHQLVIERKTMHYLMLLIMLLYTGVFLLLPSTLFTCHYFIIFIAYLLNLHCISYLILCFLTALRSSFNLVGVPRHRLYDELQP